MAVNAYSQAATSGLYAKPTGLRGKYDNVRRYWEDEATRLFFRPYLQELLKLKAGAAVRIMDIGCGCGDGYELLCGIKKRALAMSESENKLLLEEQIGQYRGLDINPELLQQGTCQYGSNDKVSFSRVDFLQGLDLAGEEPYDIFLANYGTLSHCGDEEVVALLFEITAGASNGALLIGDWLGSYCYEWQDLWCSDTESEQYLDYRISYIYEPEERKNLQLDSFPLRLMNQARLLQLLAEVNKRTPAQVVLRKVFDRSLFIGRHMETTEYKATAQPIRTLVNSLWEPAVRTDLGKLELECHFPEGFAQINQHFRQLQEQWNAMVHYTEDLLAGRAQSIHQYSNDNSLATMMEQMNILVKCTNGLGLEDARANIIEPQLAYMLRNIEMNAANGFGIGHGLGIVLEIKK